MADAFDPYHKWLGIPPPEQPPNHYRLLGISLFESDPDVIVNAADQRIVHVRAFQIGKHSDESQCILKEISVARVCLLNAAKKAEYDARLRSAMTALPVMVPAPPACSAEPPFALPAAPAVSAAAMQGQKSTHGRATRRRTTKSPLVEFVKIIVGGFAGLAIAYCLLLFVFRIDILDRLSSRKPAESRETTRRPAQPQLRSAETETKSKTPERAESRPSPSKPVTPLEPASGAATPANDRDSTFAASKTANAQAASAQPPSVNPSVDRTGQGRDKIAVSVSSPSSVTSKTAKQPPPESTSAPGQRVGSPEGASPSPPVAEALARAEERLKGDAARASSVAEHQAVAQESLAISYRAVLDSQAELARRLTMIALTAARKSHAAEVKKEATLLLIELDEPISDRLKEKARQWLSRMDSTASDAGVPRPIPAANTTSRRTAEDTKPPEKAGSVVSSVEQQRRPGDAPPSAIAPFDAAQAKSHQSTWAAHLGVPVVQTNFIGMRFVLIPPGEFDMGSTAADISRLLEAARTQKLPDFYIQGLPFAAPKHRVRITKPFYLGLSEVTQAEYERVMGSNPSKFTGNSSCPVEQVSWDDVTAFCRKLGELPQERAAHAGYRMPTEAEWEYVCRAGTATTWYGTDDEATLKEHAWFRPSAGEITHPVCQKTPNAWGLYDMHGNAWEWCQDWLGGRYYAESPTDNPTGARGGSHRVVRGGGWDCSAAQWRAASRFGRRPDDRGNNLGFRLAMSLRADIPCVIEESVPPKLPQSRDE